MSALDTQVGGSHYKDCAIQPIQYIEANNLKFLEACVIKRCTRHDKPTGKGRQDIEKAIHELQLLLDMRYPVEVKAEPLTAEELNFDEDRIDRIAASHGDGEHYGQEWIPWEGKTNTPPVPPETMVVCRLRCELAMNPRPACYISWKHEPGNSSGDVLAYKIHA